MNVQSCQQGSSVQLLCKSGSNLSFAHFKNLRLTGSNWIVMFRERRLNECSVLSQGSGVQLLCKSGSNLSSTHLKNLRLTESNWIVMFRERMLNKCSVLSQGSGVQLLCKSGSNLSSPHLQQDGQKRKSLADRIQLDCYFVLGTHVKQMFRLVIIWIET